MSLAPRIPTDLNLNHVTPISPGQKRLFALQHAVSHAIHSGITDAETVVDSAEKFHAFLAQDGAETDEEGSS